MWWSRLNIQRWDKDKQDWIKIAANHKLSGKFNLLELLEDQSSYIYKLAGLGY